MNIFGKDFNWNLFFSNKKAEPERCYGFADEVSFDVEYQDDTSTTDSNPSGYILSTTDQQRVDEWNNTHKTTCRFYDDGTQASNPIGAIGGRLTYTFTPTGLGLITTVKCACNEELDLTNYDRW